MEESTDIPKRRNSLVARISTWQFLNLLQPHASLFSIPISCQIQKARGNKPMNEHVEKSPILALELQLTNSINYNF